MIKIAILSDNFPPYPGGGTGAAHFNLYKSLIKKGYRVRVFTYAEYESLSKGIPADDDIIRFPLSNKKLAFDRKWQTIKHKCNKWFFKKKKEKGLAYQYELVRKSNLISKKINKHLIKFNPEVVFLPDFGAPAYSIDKIKTAKYIYISHHNPTRFLNNPLLEKHSNQDAYKAIKYEQASLDKMNAVVCPSEYMKKVFKSTFDYTKDIHIIPNIVDNKYIEGVTKIDLHSIIGIQKNYPIVYIPSAGSKIKGEQYVVEIIRRINKQMNNKVGFYLSGGLTDNQKHELGVLDFTNFYAPGKVNYETNIGYIKDCSICISPTLLESFGMALLEALFCDLPCVAFNVGGNESLIENNASGFLVSYLDVEDLVEKSTAILKDKISYQKLIENLKSVRDRFSSETLIKHYEEIINLNSVSKTTKDA